MKTEKRGAGGGASVLEQHSRNKSSRGGLTWQQASKDRKAGGPRAQEVRRLEVTKTRSSADLVSPADKAHAQLLANSLSGGGLIGQLGSTLPGQHMAQLHQSMQKSALWKGASSSKSLQRMQRSLLGQSAPALLSRPSVRLAAEREAVAAVAPEEKPAPLAPRGWNPAEALAIRNDRIDKYVGKLHDEELAQQELDIRLRQTGEVRHVHATIPRRPRFLPVPPPPPLIPPWCFVSRCRSSC